MFGALDRTDRCRTDSKKNNFEVDGLIGKNALSHACASDASLCTPYFPMHDARDSQCSQAMESRSPMISWALLKRSGMHAWICGSGISVVEHAVTFTTFCANVSWPVILSQSSYRGQNGERFEVELLQLRTATRSYVQLQPSQANGFFLSLQHQVSRKIARVFSLMKPSCFMFTNLVLVLG